MNRVKFYQAQPDGKVRRKTVRIGTNSGWMARGLTVREAEDRMLGTGFTRRRPPALRPHYWKEQQPGYRQPSQQQLRRARQTLRRGQQSERRA